MRHQCDSFINDRVQHIHDESMNEVIAAPGTRKAVKRAIDGFAKGQIKVFYGKYTGVNPLNPSDKIDLTKEYQENAKASAPGFCYQLDDIVTVKEMDTQQ